jgi:hypothetical protein
MAMNSWRLSWLNPCQVPPAFGLAAFVYVLQELLDIGLQRRQDVALALLQQQRVKRRLDQRQAGEGRGLGQNGPQAHDGAPGMPDQMGRAQFGGQRQDQHGLVVHADRAWARPRIRTAPVVKVDGEAAPAIRQIGAHGPPLTAARYAGMHENDWIAAALVGIMDADTIDVEQRHAELSGHRTEERTVGRK